MTPSRTEVWDVVPGDRDLAGADGVNERLLFPLDHLEGVLPDPLEGGVALGDKDGDRNRDVDHLAGAFFEAEEEVDNPLGEPADVLHVLVGLVGRLDMK